MAVLQKVVDTLEKYDDIDKRPAVFAQEKAKEENTNQDQNQEQKFEETEGKEVAT